MKRVFILFMACFCFFSVHAAYLRNIPMTINQPDGTVLQCFASGDEFFNYLHDKDGFTIIQHPQTGYYVYAENRDGNLVATEYVAGIQDPASKGLKPFALISPEAWRTKRLAWKEPEKESQNRDNRDANHGTLNNISIFIRFSDDEQFTNSYYDIDNMFNDVSEDAVSLRSYFRAASYGAIEIPTTFYPGHNGNTIISYQDTYPRSYFEPYNSTTNPNGYQESQRAEREFSLLQRAVNYVNANYPVPTSLNIDYDEDGYVDNLCFIVKGGVGAWGSLLWPHKWSLYDRVVNINGKQVWTFNFQLADATSYFNTSTMCHEMNHSLGAPDLYHYYHGEDLSPVGIWDLMEYNTTPPQHCGAYMKMKYGHWIDDIPEITQPGTYTLNPISSATPTNVAYKIATSDPNQFYVVEYRDNTSLFETGLPGKGLLVYRINTNFTGGVDYNPDEGIYDEVYIFRPGGTATQNGNYSQAYFSSDVGRPEFSSSTNPYPFFTDGTLDPSFRIYDITSAGNTISFTYGGTNGGSGEEIYIGDEGTNTNDYLPSFSYWNYSLSEQIYTANEIGTAGTIHSLAFYNGGETKTRTFDFYLMTTDKTSFVSNTDWVATTAADKVFSGEVNMVANEWTIIDFDTPFEYDGISNLILVADDNSGEWTNSPHMSCRVFDAPQQAIRIYSDDINYNPFNPTSYYGTMHNEKNQIVLVINPSLTFTKEINAYTNDGGYYLLSFPTSEVSPEEVEHMFDNIYDLYAFDECQSQEWINYKAENFSLEPGKGYLYANSQDVTLSFNSTLYNGSGEVTLFKTVEAANAGWNLVGNPFAVTAYLDRDFYVMNADGSEIIAAERDYIAPLEGVFVVAESNGEILTFSTTPSTKGQRLVLDLSKGTSISSATTVIDCAIVSFNDGSMLPKLQIKDNSNKLFIRQDGREYAVVNAGNVGEIPVSFKAESNGKYTISAHIQGVNLGYLHLVDTFTNSEIDLLSTSFYSFEASTSDDDERFKVVFAVDPGK